MADAAAIARVHVASWKTTYRGIVQAEYLAAMDVGVREQRWREQFEAAQSLTFVAEAGPEVIGFISGGALRETIAGYDAELYAIYLLESYQRQGVGKALVRELAKDLLAARHGGMVVWVLADNPAVEFYKRLGANAILGKMITIGEMRLPELALGWPSLDALA